MVLTIVVQGRGQKLSVQVFDKCYNIFEKIGGRKNIHTEYLNDMSAEEILRLCGESLTETEKEEK